MKLQVGVKIFLRNKEGKYLLVQRNTEKYKGTKGTWDIVGGRINSGETLLKNLAREVKEETELTIASAPRLIHAQDIIPNDEKHVVRLTYIGTTEGEPVLDTNENVAYEWLSVSEIESKDDLDIYVKEVIEKGLVE